MSEDLEASIASSILLPTAFLTAYAPGAFPESALSMFAGKVGLRGLLRSHEVFNLRLGAELVVLSGCATGLGKEVRRGLYGMTRGFMYAGSKPRAGELWDASGPSHCPVNDGFLSRAAGTGSDPVPQRR